MYAPLSAVSFVFLEILVLTLVMNSFWGEITDIGETKRCTHLFRRFSRSRSRWDSFGSASGPSHLRFDTVRLEPLPFPASRLSFRGASISAPRSGSCGLSRESRGGLELRGGVGDALLCDCTRRFGSTRFSYSSPTSCSSLARGGSGLADRPVWPSLTSARSVSG